MCSTLLSHWLYCRTSCNQCRAPSTGMEANCLDAVTMSMACWVTDAVTARLSSRRRRKVARLFILSELPNEWRLLLERSRVSAGLHVQSRFFSACYLNSCESHASGASLLRSHKTRGLLKSNPSSKGRGGRMRCCSFSVCRERLELNLLPLSPPQPLLS